MLSTPLGRYRSILLRCGLRADSHRPGEPCRLIHPGGGVRWKREITSGRHSGCPKESPYLPASSAIRATSGSLTRRSISESSRKKFSKPAGADYLDHPSQRLCGVPHGVHLVARLGDVSTGTQDNLTVTG